MDNNLLSFIIIFATILIILINKDKRNNIDLKKNSNDILIQSFLLTLGIMLAISLIIYALFDEIVFELSATSLRFGILISGIILFNTGLNALRTKNTIRNKKY